MRFSRHGRIGPLLRFLSVVVVGLTTGFFRRDWRHLGRIPRTGPAILAVNHVSYADPFLVARLVWDAGRIPRFLGKATLFGVPVIGPVLRGAGQIPVRRATREATDSLESAVAALHEGEIVVIYPEGTVTRDDDYWPMVAKTGVGRLALLVPEAPVIPVAQWGSQDAVDWYHRRFRLLPRKQVTIAVGLPVDTAPYRSATGPPATTVGPEPSPQTLRALTDAIMSAVRSELAGIRGVPAPTTFTARPPASVVKVSMPAVSMPAVSMPAVSMPPVSMPAAHRPAPDLPARESPADDRPDNARPDNARPDDARPDNARPDDARPEDLDGRARPAGSEG